MRRLRVTLTFEGEEAISLLDKSARIGEPLDALLHDVAVKHYGPGRSVQTHGVRRDTLANQIVEMVEDHYHDNDIATILRCSPATVRKKREEAGYPPNYRNDHTTRDIHDYYAAQAAREADK